MAILRRLPWLTVICVFVAMFFIGQGTFHGRNWKKLVSKAKKCGFTKVTIISRNNSSTLAVSSKKAKINDIQELKSNWKSPTKKSIRFYGKKFNIVLRDDEDGNYIAARTGNQVLCARRFKSIWFVAYGPVKGKDVGFLSAQEAFAKITNNIWDALDEAGV